MTDDDARERIVSAASDLYYRKGFTAVGMDELRREAGVSLRRLYSLFPSKDDIILEVLACKRQAWTSGVTECADAVGDDPRERLLSLFTFLQLWFTTDSFRGCAFVNAFGELGGTHPEVVEIIREHKSEAQGYISALVHRAGGDEELASELSLLSEGAQIAAAISGDPSAAGHARKAATVLLDAALG